MDLGKIIEAWIETSNSYNTKKYLEFYHEDAVLDDPSVGRKFNGKNGISEYFENYFIGYKTQTKIASLVIKSKNRAYLKVEFTGDFPEGKIGGSFDFIFKEGKITHLSADLL